MSSYMDNSFADALQQILTKECTPRVIRQIEHGDSCDSLWASLEESGFPNAMVPEEDGGAGLSLTEAFPLLELCGAHALPLPLGETMVMRALLSASGQPGRGGIQRIEAGHELPTDLVNLLACVYSAQLSGALQTTFKLTLQYANERAQFGRAIGKFQAIQHQLSVMAEHVFAARMAAQMGCSAPLQQLSLEAVAVAKDRTSEAAQEVAAIAHAVHGAIGFTEEYDLQLYTRRLHDWRCVGGSESYWHDVLGSALVSRNGSALDLARAVSDVSWSPA